MTKVYMEVKLLNENAKLPSYGSIGAAGMDISSCEDIIIYPRSRRVVHTGIAVSIPFGYELQVRSRSGLAFKNLVTVFPGTIDSDYRGEIKVLVDNYSNERFFISKGMRVAQMVLNKIDQAHIVKVDALNKTERGEKGFGSTGV